MCKFFCKGVDNCFILIGDPWRLCAIYFCLPPPPHALHIGMQFILALGNHLSSDISAAAPSADAVTHFSALILRHRVIQKMLCCCFLLLLSTVFCQCLCLLTINGKNESEIQLFAFYLKWDKLFKMSLQLFVRQLFPIQGNASASVRISQKILIFIFIRIFS